MRETPVGSRQLLKAPVPPNKYGFKIPIHMRSVVINGQPWKQWALDNFWSKKSTLAIADATAK
jgi:hypothetical protein